MGVTTALVLAALVGAAPAATAKPRLLLLPVPSEAPAADQAFFNALSAAVQASPVVTWIPWAGLPSVSRADDEALEHQIEATLTAVQAAYRRLDTEEAARRLNILENAQLNLLGCPERIALAAKISFWLGVVYAANKATEAAAERFAAVLSSDPAYPIDASYFPPQTVALFEKVRKGLAAAPTGGLSISGEPDAAEVFLDGKPVGRAPVTLNAPAGDHFVCVRRLGWKDWAARLKLTAGRVETQRIFLQRASPADINRQLAALFGGRPVTLDDPAQIEALAAALSVDVVAATRAHDTVIWRLVSDPNQPHEATAADPEALTDARAGQVLGALERSLGATPVALAVPEAPPAPARFSLDVAGHGGGGLSLVHGGLLGARLGFFWYPHPAIGVGAQVGVAKGLGVVPLLDPSQPDKPVRAVAPDALEVPIALGARWTLLDTQRLRLFLTAGLGLRFVLCAPAVGLPTPPQSPVLEMPPEPLSLLLLGPHLGAGTVIAVTPGAGILLGVEYGLEFLPGPVAVPSSLMTRNLPPMPVGPGPMLTVEPLLNVVTVDLGVQWSF